MRSLAQGRQGWSRRHFLVLGISVPALLPAIAQTSPPGLVRTPASGDLLVVASPDRLTFPLRARRLLLLEGDRLARLNQMRRLLQAGPLSGIELHLDATDRLMWDVALADAGTLIADEQLLSRQPDVRQVTLHSRTEMHA